MNKENISKFIAWNLSMDDNIIVFYRKDKTHEFENIRLIKEKLNHLYIDVSVINHLNEIIKRYEKWEENKTYIIMISSDTFIERIDDEDIDSKLKYVEIRKVGKKINNNISWKSIPMMLKKSLLSM
jgi:hypothetical protein